MIERDGHERRQVEPVILTSLVYCVLLLWTKEISALADFSAEYKSRSVCENNELKLHCKEPKLLNIYSAVYGRFAHEKNACPTAVDRGTPYDCLSYAALEVLTHRCYGKQRCKMMVSDGQFGSPCLPGVIKYLTINYSCDVKLDPHESRLPKRDGIFLSNSLAAFAYIKDHPEKAALFFVSSVCIGLIFTLLALATRVSWRSDWRKLPQMNGQIVREKARDDDSSEEEEGEDEASLKSHFSEEFRELCKSQRPVYSAMDAADLAERIERREQIIQEIWMNSGLDLPPNTHTSPFI
ncbi:hypothetical protein FKM82_008145 [Ascaphus truei]